MNKKYVMIIIGVSLVLTACSGKADTTEPASVEQTVVAETVVAQDEKESLSGQSEQQEKPEETESSEEMDSQKETETSKEADSEQETNSDAKTEPDKTAETEQETVETKAAGPAEEKVSQATGSFTQADIAVSIRGVSVTPGEIMENYVNALGEPDALDASPSCVEAGDDKTYTYGGVIIYSYRANGTDRINLIEITGTESLVKGIHIGDTTEAVIAAYGDSYTMDGDEMLYEVNDKVMGFLIANGKVSFMELFAR